MSQSAGVKCLDRYGFPLAGLTAAEQAVRAEATARESKLYDKWSRQVARSSCSSMQHRAATTALYAVVYMQCAVCLKGLRLGVSGASIFLY